MADTRIDPNSVPAGMPRAEDFLMAEAYKTSGMSGRNHLSSDTTAVLNMPDSPDGEGKMIAIWAYPERQPELANLGIHPVPAHWFENGFNGGRPVIAASSSARIVNGRMLRDYGIEVMLFTTMPSTYRQIQLNEARMAESRKTGRDVIGAEAKAFDDLMSKQNVTAFTDEQSFVERSGSTATGQVMRQKRPLSVSVPA